MDVVSTVVSPNIAIKTTLYNLKTLTLFFHIYIPHYILPTTIIWGRLSGDKYLLISCNEMHEAAGKWTCVSPDFAKTDTELDSCFAILKFSKDLFHIFWIIEE